MTDKFASKLGSRHRAFELSERKQKERWHSQKETLELPDSFKRMDRAFSDLDAEFPVAGGRTPLVYQEKKVDSRSFIPEGKVQTPVEPRGEHPAMKALREAGDKLPEAS